MTRRNTQTGAHEDYSIKGRTQATYLGTTEDDTAMLYNEDHHQVFRGDPDKEEETIRPVKGSDRQLDDDHSIGDEIRRIADEHGWQSVSEFAQNLLGADDG